MGVKSPSPSSSSSSSPSSSSEKSTAIIADKNPKNKRASPPKSRNSKDAVPPKSDELIFFWDKNDGSITSIKESKKQTNTVEWIHLIILLICGFLTRFFRWEYPREVVFDEQHFGKFASWYLRGDYYLDIHPPLAKLVMTLIAKLSGYDGSWEFDQTDIEYSGNFFLWLRLGPVFLGSLLPALTYLTARSMKLNPSISALVGWCILLENIIITESRYILTDSFLFFFDMLSVYCSFKANSKPILSSQWFMWMFFTGISLGCCCSVKFTALGVLGTIGLHQIFHLIKNHNSLNLRFFLDAITRGFLTLTPLIIIFVVCFLIHFLILPFYGDGDPFMSYEFLRTLTFHDGSVNPIYHTHEVGPAPSMLSSVFQLVKIMHDANIGLTATHPFSSLYTHWPLIQCRVLLFWQKFKTGYGIWIYCVGNPSTWLISLFVGVFGWFFFMIYHSGFLLKEATTGTSPVFRVLQKKIHRLQQPTNPSSSSSSTHYPLRDLIPFSSCLYITFSRHFITGLTIWIGYIANWAPYYLIPRATWNYHYIPALMFAILNLGVVLQILDEATYLYQSRWNSVVRFFCFFIIVAVALSWTFLSPWTYAFPLSDEQHDSRFLFKSWYA